MIEKIDLNMQEMTEEYMVLYQIFSNTGMRAKEVIFLEEDCLEKSKYPSLMQLKYKPYKVISARRKIGAPDYHRMLITNNLADEIKNQIERTKSLREEYKLPYIFIKKTKGYKACMVSMYAFRNKVNI